MATALADVRHALRVLSRHKAFTLAALGILTIAIGSNIAIFTLVADTLLRPLPLPDPARLVRVEEHHAGQALNLTGATFVDLHEQARTFDAIAAYRLTSPGFSTGSLPEQVTAAEVSADYFDVLGVLPALGRPLDARDAEPGSARTVVISHALWQRRFGGDPSAVGRQVLVNAVPTELVGVMPPRFFAPGTPDIWVARFNSNQFLRNRRAHLYSVPDAREPPRAGALDPRGTRRQPLAARPSAGHRKSAARPRRRRGGNHRGRAGGSGLAHNDPRRERSRASLDRRQPLDDPSG